MLLPPMKWWPLEMGDILPLGGAVLSLVLPGGEMPGFLHKQARLEQFYFYFLFLLPRWLFLATLG